MHKHQPLFPLLAVAGLLTTWPSSAYTADVAAEPVSEEAPEEDPGPWSHSLKFGAFLNQTAAYNEDSSRDSNIQSSSDSISYRLSFDGKLDWVEGANEVQQKLRLRYGRVKEEDSEWDTNSDEIRYDIMGLHVLEGPHFLYVSGRAQTVFEEPDPGNDTLTPGLVYISSGYGQRYKNIFLPIEDSFQITAGVRAQRRWGDNLTSREREIKVGLEARVEYSNTIREGLDWRFEAESFAPFEDLGHISTWAEIALDVQISDHIIASMSARAYYETQPDYDNTSGGYDELSLRQEALIGLSWAL